MAKVQVEESEYTELQELAKRVREKKDKSKLKRTIRKEVMDTHRKEINDKLRAAGFNPRT